VKKVRGTAQVNAQCIREVTCAENARAEVRAAARNQNNAIRGCERRSARACLLFRTAGDSFLQACVGRPSLPDMIVVDVLLRTNAVYVSC